MAPSMARKAVKASGKRISLPTTAVSQTHASTPMIHIVHSESHPTCLRQNVLSRMLRAWQQRILAQKSKMYDEPRPLFLRRLKSIAMKDQKRRSGISAVRPSSMPHPRRYSNEPTSDSTTRTAASAM
eukprot:3720309-Pleurochrysis_carterae.AAC.1